MPAVTTFKSGAVCEMRLTSLMRRWLVRLTHWALQVRVRRPVLSLVALLPSRQRLGREQARHMMCSG